MTFVGSHTAVVTAPYIYRDANIYDEMIGYISVTFKAYVLRLLCTFFALSFVRCSMFVVRCVRSLSFVFREIRGFSRRAEGECGWRWGCIITYYPGACDVGSQSYRS